jgi:tetratricopeptide (TPR) repeat protein
MRLHRARIWFLLPLVLAVLARADIVYLKNGNQLHGEVVKDDGEVVILRTTDGEIKLRAADVEAIERESSTATKLRLGQRQLDLGNTDRAVAIFEDARRTDPKSDAAARMLAAGYLAQAKKCQELNRLADARGAYTRLLKLDPKAQHVAHDAAAALKEIESQERSATETVAGARTLAKDANWPAAIAAFRKALDTDPALQPLVATELAQCHVRRAAAHASDHRLLNAAADLEAALTLDPALGDRIENFYVSCALPGIMASLSKGDVASAQVDLARVLATAPANKRTLYVQGRMEESLNHLPQAAAAYAQALGTRAANPTPEFTAELRRRLEGQLGLDGNEWRIDTTFSELKAFAASTPGPPRIVESDHFRVLHNNETLALEVASRAEAALTRVAAAVGLPIWRNQATVRLYRTQAEYTAATNEPEWAGGSCRVRGRGPTAELDLSSWQTSPRLLTSVLPHEIAHLVVNSNLAENANPPVCLREGISVLMEPSFRHEYYLSILRSAVRKGSVPPLAETLAARQYPAEPELFYAQGYALLAYLTQTKQLPEIVAVLRETAPQRAAADLLRLSGHASLDEFEAAWKAWVLKTKGR